MKIFSIKNEKLGFFNRPMFCESSEECLSLIQNILMSDSDRALTGLKEELTLYYLGDIDFRTGIISPSLASIDSAEEAFAIDNYQPYFICSLIDIFNSIPAERIKREVSRDDIERLFEYYKTLKDTLDKYTKSFDSHTHTHKKGVVRIDS